MRFQAQPSTQPCDAVLAGLRIELMIGLIPFHQLWSACHLFVPEGISFRDKLILPSKLEKQGCRGSVAHIMYGIKRLHKRDEAFHLLTGSGCSHLDDSWMGTGAVILRQTW